MVNLGKDEGNELGGLVEQGGGKTIERCWWGAGEYCGGAVGDYGAGGGGKGSVPSYECGPLQGNV